MRSTAGRIVTLEPRPDADGLWHAKKTDEPVERVPSWLDVEAVRALRARGLEPAEITLVYLSQVGAPGKKPATVHRHINTVLRLDGGRKIEEQARAPHVRDPEGEADLPAVLRGL